MKKLAFLSVMVVLLAGAGLTAATPADSTDAKTNNTTNLTSGEQLSSVLAMQSASLQSDIDQRAFGLKLAKADSKEARAELIAQRQEELQERAKNISQRVQKLKELRKSGEISQSEFVARISGAHVEAKELNESANQTTNQAKDLPAEVLKQNGVNVTALKTLQQKADTLTGPEVAQLAQKIAGNAPVNVDKKRPDHAGPKNKGPSDKGPKQGNKTTSGNQTDTNETDKSGNTTSPRPDNIPN